MKPFIIAASLLLLAPAARLNGVNGSWELGVDDGQAAAITSLKTKPEATNFEQTSRFEDVVSFLNELAKAAPKTIKLKTFGATTENRALPLVVVGASDPTPEAVRRTGKLRVYIQGNIHGGEVEGKESAQMLLRDLAAGEHQDWLKHMVLLVAPIYNADGNERFSLTNRGRQHGPIGGQGQRPNAQGLDLNRDHMKLDSPEARAVVKLMNDYDPHVSMDLHTTNGTRHAYYLTYSPPLNPATDPTITSLLRNTWFPAITQSIRTKYGWDYYYYGNVEGARGAGGERAWRSFDHRPRFNNNYIGLRNRFALLSEAFAYATFKDRITATSRFVEENLDFIAKNASRIRRIVADADRRAVIGQRLGLRARMVKGPEMVEVLMGEVTQEKHPADGHIMELRKDVKIPEKMADYGTFEATETERVPTAYLIPLGHKEAVDLLVAHGILVERFAGKPTIEVEEFQIETNTQPANAFQNHRERALTGKWIPAKRTLPEGTLIVRMNQPLARLAFYLLEPRSDDGLVNWNFLDAALGPEVKVYPILRSRN
jgi:hypothetical protein